jgi:hypothetical protein
MIKIFRLFPFWTISLFVTVLLREIAVIIYGPFKEMENVVVWGICGTFATLILYCETRISLWKDSL